MSKWCCRNTGWRRVFCWLDNLFQCRIGKICDLHDWVITND